ncbi:MAG: hypothetical protein Q8O37_17190 [Sulfuricellaceae bacterium]|nr:hypothetical protein [Sulfuricellaceae bacterium]
MNNTSSQDAVQESVSATNATSSVVPETSTPAEKSAAKTAPKHPAKPAVKPAAKPIAKAPTIATAKPAKEPAAEQEATVKDEAAKTDKNAKPKKAKLVRDSFTMPESEYDLIDTVKKRCLANGLAVKKSEVLRAAITAFAAQSDAAVSAALQALDAIKTGRPPKAHK